MRGRPAEQVVEACRRMQDEGLVCGTAGNVSVRLDDEVLITPSGVAYEELGADDLSVVALDGSVLRGPLHPSSETPMHLAIYRATDAQAIVHTHADYATAVGLVIDELPPVHYAIHALGGTVRVAEYATFGSGELASNVLRALEGRTGALMRNHGAITIGADLAGAYDRAAKLEWLAALLWRSSLLGSPALLTSEQLQAVRERARQVGYQP